MSIKTEAEKALEEARSRLSELQNLFIHLTTGNYPRFYALNSKISQVEFEIEMALEDIATLEGEDWIDD